MWARLHPGPGASTASLADVAVEPRSLHRRASPLKDPLRRVRWRDAVIVAVLTVATWLVCGIFNVTEMLRRLTAPYERYQLDEVPMALLAMGLALSWFATRRYHEARREIARRKSAEERLAAVLRDNRRLAQQYVELQEAERKALARELHDELGQYLNVIKIDAVGIRDDPRVDLEAVHGRASAIVDNCDHVHGALATLIRELRPAGLDDLGLAAALEHCVQAWRTRLPAVVLRLSVTGDFTALPEGLAVTAYRLVQEALTNVAKHSAARLVRIRLDRAASLEPLDDAVTVAVEDDGIGTDPNLAGRGLGLIGMRERVIARRGELAIQTSPGRGFKLMARIPIQTASRNVS